MLADCTANQQAQYFCAWRDKLRAAQALDAAVAQRGQASASCSQRLTQETPRWKAQVQHQCQAAAAREWGGGSLQRTAELSCTAAAFGRAASAVATGSDKRCRLPAPGR